MKTYCAALKPVLYLILMFKTGYYYLEVSLPDSESVFLLLLRVGPQTVADATDNDHHGKSAHARQDNNYGPRN